MALRIILASTSPWRLKMLHEAGVHAVGRASGVNESVMKASSFSAPSGLAMALARAKARAVADHHPGAWVIGADQVVHQGDEVFGKPRDPAEHLTRLMQMRGRSHDLCTAWALVGPGAPAEGVAVTRMVVRSDLTDAELQSYVDSGEGSGCAGGYAAEGRGAALFARMDGDFFNIIGLPLLDLLSALRARGWRMEAS